MRKGKSQVARKSETGSARTPTAETAAGLGPSTPASHSAAALLRPRLDELEQSVARVHRAADRPTGEVPESVAAIRHVHKLRVACRRAAAALMVFEELLPGKAGRRLIKVVKRIRRESGLRRNADVLIDLAERWARTSPKVSQVAAREVVRELKRRARRMTPAFDELLDDAHVRELERLTKRVLARVERRGDSAGVPRTLEALAAERVGESLRAVERASQTGLRDDDAVHDLRVKLKRLRYALEVLEPGLDAAMLAPMLKGLRRVQACMGEFNDQATLTRAVALIETEEGGRLASETARRKRTQSPRGSNRGSETKSGWSGLRALYARRTDELREKAVEAWRAFRGSVEWTQINEWTQASVARSDSRQQLGKTGRMIEAKGVAPEALTQAASSNQAGHSTSAGKSSGTLEMKGVGPRSRPGQVGRFRLAAIDVGSNSLRLIVAEAASDGSYRVLDDEKETTRLGRGAHETGRMDPAAIEHSAIAVQRMRSIAEGYGAQEIRVVGTAAARDSSNGDELVRAVRRAAGLEMKIISAQEEAQYAYRSAARAFDLSTGPSIVIDIGGGSTEVILSVAGDQHQGRSSSDRERSTGEVRAPRAAGFIERIYTIPIGAVRLTEQFGGESAACGKRFSKLTAFLDELVKEHVGRPPVWPQLVVGTGGTITTLGAMVALRDAGTPGDGLFSGTVQGMLVKRADLRHMVELLRKLPLKQRSRVAGLSAERADIIVPGLAILDAVLKRFKANALRVHEGGIRDGLLLSMVTERTGAASVEKRCTPEFVLRGARRFARACSYEMAHSEHVAALALSLFDQLRAMGLKPRSGPELSDEGRLLLEVAAVLHDIGYLINYAQHHKHSYHLIVHAELAGLTTRQTQIVANVARYHRASEPKPKHRAFGALDESDRELVRALSGILRVADGLDRTHTQQVRAVHLDKKRTTIEARIESSGEASVDMWGAHRKSGLFQSVFGRKMNIEWHAGASPAAPAKRPARDAEPSVGQ